MTLPPPFVPKPVRPRHYCYAIVSKDTTPPALISVHLSRSEARKAVEFDPDAENLRIRRGCLTLYES